MFIYTLQLLRNREEHSLEIRKIKAKRIITFRNCGLVQLSRTNGA
jgi:hypothetical protein